MADASINWSAPYAAKNGSIRKGDVLCKADDLKTYVKATAANLAAVGGIVSGISLEDSVSATGAVRMQCNGEISADVSGLGPGPGMDYVGVNSSGRLVRTNGYQVGAIGQAFADGSVKLFGSLGGNVGNLSVPGWYNVKDYGAKGDFNPSTSYGTDDSAAFAAAIAAMSPAAVATGAVLYIPPGYYRLASTVHITRQMAVVGGGPGGPLASTQIYPDRGVTAFVVDRVATSPDGGRGDYSHFENMRIVAWSIPSAWQPNINNYQAQADSPDPRFSTYGSVVIPTGLRARTILTNGRRVALVMVCVRSGRSGSTEPTWPTTLGGEVDDTAGTSPARWRAVEANGITAFAQCTGTRVYIENMGSDGLHVYGNNTDTPSTNANLCAFDHCQFRNCAGSGVVLNGVDANQASFLACDGSNSKLWGFEDHSFLGNQYFACHTNQNGTQVGIWQSGTAYATNAIVKPPTDDTTTTYYYKASSGGTSGGSAPTWRTDTTPFTDGSVTWVRQDYLSALGGPFYADSLDAENSYVGCYSEMNQNPSVFLGPQTIVSGLHAAGVTGGIIVSQQGFATPSFGYQNKLGARVVYRNPGGYSNDQMITDYTSVASGPTWYWQFGSFGGTFEAGDELTMMGPASCPLLSYTNVLSGQAGTSFLRFPLGFIIGSGTRQFKSFSDERWLTNGMTRAVGDRWDEYAPVQGGFEGKVVVRAGMTAPAWQSGHAYALNATVTPTVDNGHYYKATAVTGNSGGSEPSPWNTGAGSTTTDGGVTWTEQGTSMLAVPFGVVGPISGATASLPVSPPTGREWFDTTLSRPLWWSGIEWVVATGCPVSSLGSQSWANQSSSASGSQSIAWGQQASASGSQSIAIGYLTNVSANRAAGFGDRTNVTREGQLGLAGGAFTSGDSHIGEAQWNVIVLRASATGSSQFVELSGGDNAGQFLTLEEGKAYFVRYEAISGVKKASGSPAYATNSWTGSGMFYMKSGSVSGVGTPVNTPDPANLAGYTFAMGVGSGKLAFQYQTGPNADTSNIECSVYVSEVILP